jgi:hypothetical protein
VLMVLPSFGGAWESRNLLHGAHAFRLRRTPRVRQPFLGAQGRTGFD